MSCRSQSTLSLVDLESLAGKSGEGQVNVIVMLPCVYRMKLTVLCMMQAAAVGFEQAHLMSTLTSYDALLSFGCFIISILGATLT